MTRFSLALLLSLLAGSLAAHPSNDGHWHMAQNGTVTVDDLDGADPRLHISLEEAVEQVRRETGGRVLSAKTEYKGSAIVHRIKVLTPQQQVQVHEIDAGDAR